MDNIKLLQIKLSLLEQEYRAGKNGISETVEIIKLNRYINLQLKELV